MYNGIDALVLILRFGERAAHNGYTAAHVSHPALNSPDEALAAVLTDGTFSCPALVTDELLSLQVPTFGYEFADRNAPMLFLPPVSFPYGATHTDELQFLFTNLGGVPSQLSADETKLATTMKDYWTQFAKAGTPNALILRQPSGRRLLSSIPKSSPWSRRRRSRVSTFRRSTTVCSGRIFWCRAPCLAC